MDSSEKVDWLMPGCQEKLLNVECKVTVPKPTQVGGVEYTKARERKVVKELGKLTPYLRKKGSSSWLAIYL